MYKFTFMYVCILLWIRINSKAVAKNKLLLISFDGFRYDYIDHYKPKNLMKLIEAGVYGSSGMYPVFPTKTFPNHYSLVTGLYPESHGVVDNSMYDPLFNETFELNVDTDTKWFDQAEPIWITAKLQGLVTGACFWPGASTEIHGTRANFFTQFNYSVPFKNRVDDTIDWFTQHDASFVALYFEEPDSAGHQYGVLSDKIQEMVETMDGVLGDIVERLKKQNLFDTMNIILISDHGMINTSRKIEENLILDKYLEPDDYVIIPQTGPLAQIMPQKGKSELVYNKLKNANPHVKVYKKEDLPERFHYRNNRRIMPILAIADEHYQIMKTAADFYNSTLGQHGYDNTLTSMKPVFLAVGPAFKAKVTIEPFQNFYIYPLMCHLLGIKPQPNNGSLDVFKDVLKIDTSAADSFKLNCVGNIMAVTLITNWIAKKYFF